MCKPNKHFFIKWQIEKHIYTQVHIRFIFCNLHFHSDIEMDLSGVFFSFTSAVCLISKPWVVWLSNGRRALGVTKELLYEYISRPERRELRQLVTWGHNNYHDCFSKITTCDTLETYLMALFSTFKEQPISLEAFAVYACYCLMRLDDTDTV